MEIAHATMIKNWKARGEPPEPISVQRNWVDVAKERWGAHWGQVAAVILSSTTDYLDTPYNKYVK
eukprot:5102970-Karenia_brevis.AAC.1